VDLERQLAKEPKILNINETVERLEQVLQQSIGEPISLATYFDPNAGLAQADPEQGASAHKPGGQCARCNAGGRRPVDCVRFR
jgi:hypothetical protein